MYIQSLKEPLKDEIDYDYDKCNYCRPRAWGYKKFFMLNSAEHENFYASKYENAKNSWHFHNH